MKSTFQKRDGDSTPVVLQEVKRAFEELGENAVSKFFTRVSIATTETRVAHGVRGIPRWRAWNPEGPGVVYQVRAPDERFLYLVASAAVVTGIEVF